MRNEDPPVPGDRIIADRFEEREIRMTTVACSPAGAGSTLFREEIRDNHLCVDSWEKNVEQAVQKFLGRFLPDDHHDNRNNDADDMNDGPEEKSG